MKKFYLMLSVDNPNNIYRDDSTLRAIFKSSLSIVVAVCLLIVLNIISYSIHYHGNKNYYNVTDNCLTETNINICFLFNGFIWTIVLPLILVVGIVSYAFSISSCVSCCNKFITEVKETSDMADARIAQEDDIQIQLHNIDD